MIVRLLSPIRHNGQRLQTGVVIEVSEESATRLISLKVAENMEAGFDEIAGTLEFSQYAHIHTESHKICEFDPNNESFTEDDLDEEIKDCDVSIIERVDAMSLDEVRKKIKENKISVRANASEKSLRNALILHLSE